MRILTLNTWGEGGPWRERWDMIFGGLEAYAPEVVTFQEVFNKGWGRETAKRAAFPYWLCPDAPGSGLMLLSRFPIRGNALYVMERKSPFEDYLRHALWAEIESEGGPLHIFTTHLSWMLDDGETRRAQAGELRDWMAEKAGADDIVLTGDLNAPPDAAEIRWLVEASGLIDAFAALHPGKSGFSWDNGNSFAAGHRIPLPDRRIDYILARGDRMTRNLRACDLVFDRPDRSGLFASDHFGVMAEFGRLHGQGRSARVDGGRADVGRVDRNKVQQEWAQRGFSCDLWVDPPGRVWADFIHDTDELVMLVEGEEEFEMNGEKHRLEAGEELLIPARTYHTARNVGTGTSKWLYGYRRS